MDSGDALLIKATNYDIADWGPNAPWRHYDVSLSQGK